MLNTKFKKASGRGGKCTEKLKNEWKSSNYDFKIYYHELDQTKLVEENERLRGEKRKAEEALAAEKGKRMKTEEMLSNVIAQEERSRIQYKEKFKTLAKRVAKIQNKAKKGPNKDMSFNDYTPQQARIKRGFKQDIQTTLSFLGIYNFVATKVEILNNENGTYDTITLNDDLQLNSDAKEITDQDLDDVNYWIFIKDKYNLSNEAWHELAMKCKEMPTKGKISREIGELNKKWTLKETPGEAEGIQVSFKESLTEQLLRLEENGKIGEADSTIKIKISGDGTNIGKRLKLENITYTILNEKENAMSERGNYPLATTKTPENYECLKESLADLNKEMSELKDIKVNNRSYKIEYFLGGDWKFLACVCGIGAANQEFACIWCKCPREERSHVDKNWSLSDKSSGARDHQEITDHSKHKKFNCKYSPLFDYIPIDHVMIDTLHLFLRISDILIELLIRELKRHDCLEKTTKLSNGFIKEKYAHLAGYETFLRKLGINFEWKVNKDTRKLEYRDLTGPEKLILIQNIDFEHLLPNYTETREMKVIWDGFMEIIGDLKLDYTTEESINQLEEKLKRWLENFLAIYQGKDVTPYMHALYAHVPEFLRLYANISQFNQQGMEKYNDIVSKNYFRSSNHRGIEALRQLMFKKMRMQFLEGKGYEREKNSYTCGNCGTQGHTIKTCTKKCPTCNHTTYCSHLVKVGGKWVPRCSNMN